MLYRSNRGRQRSGVAATELALLAPFLVLIAGIGVDFGRIFYYTITLQYCARDACYWASDYPGIYAYTTAGQAGAREGESLDLKTTSLTLIVSASSSAAGTYTEYSRFVVTKPSDTLVFTVTGGATGRATEAPSGSNFIKVEALYQFSMVTNILPWQGTTMDLKRSTLMAVAPIVPTSGT